MRSTEANPARTERMYSGAATKVWARTTARMVNGMVMPIASNGVPSTPRRPSTSSSASPATVGGSTMGRSTMASTRPLPRNSRRASSSASGVPKTTARTRLASVVTRLSTSASSTARSPACWQQLAAEQGAREQRRDRQAQEQQRDDREDDPGGPEVPCAARA